MKLKTVNIEGKVFAEVSDDGKPIYVYEDGKEIAFDAPASRDKIGQLNAEAKGHREAKEAAEAALKKYEGIDDVDAARTALETVANLKAGELTTAAKVQEIKDAARKTAEDQIAEIKRTYETQVQQQAATINELRTGWDGERIGTRFMNSKFVADKLAVPGAVAQKIFGDAFRIEDNQVVAYGPDGKKIYSRENPGEVADFDDALSTLVDKFPHRDSIVRGSGGGSGGRGGAGNGGLGAKEMTRAEFDQLDPVARGAKIKEGITVVDAA